MLKYENKYYLKAKELVDQINQNLPKKIEATCYTLNSKLPFKVFSLRELLIHRIGELSFVAINSFKNENVVPSIILIRSVFETTAVLVRLSNKIENVLKNNNEIDAFDDFLMKSLFGCRDGSNDIQAYNILTLVDHVDKKYPKFRESYDFLSEFVHPNWNGLMGSYSNLVQKDYTLYLGKEQCQLPNDVILRFLIASLETFIECYNDMEKYLTEFNRLCDDYFKNKSEN